MSCGDWFSDRGADGAVLEPGGINEASGYRSWRRLARQPAEVVGGSRRDSDAIEGAPGPAQSWAARAMSRSRTMSAPIAA